MIEPKEKQIHLGIIQALNLFAAPGVIFWHTPNNRMSAREGGYWKRMGVLAGIPDLQIAIPGRGITFLEIKKPGGRLNAAQKAVRTALEAAGCTYAIVTSIDEAIDVLRFLGALKGMERAA